MNFLLDEQLPAVLARRLEGEGYHAAHISDCCGYGTSDVDVAREALRRQAVLITKDFDFVLMSARSELSCQIVWVRLGNTNNDELWRRLRQALPQILAELGGGVRVVQVV